MFSIASSFSLIASLFIAIAGFAAKPTAPNKTVAITMDDLVYALPGMSIDEMEAASDSLLGTLTAGVIPVTVFVNGKSFENGVETARRLGIYRAWAGNPLVTVGNHTYSHMGYADTTFAAFAADVINGEVIIGGGIVGSGTRSRYFRFPYNATGRDKETRDAMSAFLDGRGYVVTPFTVESGDYMYNALYCAYLKDGKKKEADEIARKYIENTVKLFGYFDRMTNEMQGRSISHIYLCHVNQLNADHFGELAARLKEAGYAFVTLDEAMQDSIYASTDHYTQSFGVSWLYRWIADSDERKARMRKEPAPADIEKQYNALTQ